MQDNLIGKGPRINSIDVLRGIALVIMTFESLNFYFNSNLTPTDPYGRIIYSHSFLLIFSKFITIFFVPILVFLSGLSMYLKGLSYGRINFSKYLIKRGFVLIIFQVFILSLAYTFLPFYKIIWLQFIWVIGIATILLGLLKLINLKLDIVFILGLLLVFSNNLLDHTQSFNNLKYSLGWAIFQHGGKYFLEKGGLVIIFPGLALMSGLFLLGYTLGVLFQSNFHIERRRKLLNRLGIILLVSFFFIRYLNIYGDPSIWIKEASNWDTLISYMSVSTYPPSILYLCLTMGLILLLLIYLEKKKNLITSILSLFGRTAVFFSITMYLLGHLICGIVFFVSGHVLPEAIDSLLNLPVLFVMPGQGFSLKIVYLIWVGLIAILFICCKGYEHYRNYTNKLKKSLL